MRILQIVPVFSPSFGGIFSVVRDISRELAKKHEVSVYTTTHYDREGDSDPKKEFVDGYQVFYFRRNLRRSFLGKLNISFDLMKAFQENLSNFDVILTSDHITKGKPDPLIYITACEKLSSESALTVIFEDSNLGIEAAVRSGCKAIMIPDLKAPNQFALDNAFRIYDSLTTAMARRNEWL